ncbi:MAG TPA: nuclear transport factor 2 family protein [Thermoleophilaceae bacterium]|nr:nuclear transport factor 2 family protein [Actinomycetota bacterium]HYN51092.1 nuclear transport factor 2 family protein [Thermoleophilaceae bacterium]
MDQTDIEVVKAVFSAFAQRDVDGVLAHAANDVIFSPVTADHAGRTEAYVGHDGIRDYFRDVASVWDHITVTPTKFRQVGDTVLVTGKISAVAPGRLVAGSTGWIWRLREGKVVYGRVYPSAGAAIAAMKEDDPA